MGSKPDSTAFQWHNTAQDRQAGPCAAVPPIRSKPAGKVDIPKMPNAQMRLGGSLTLDMRQGHRFHVMLARFRVATESLKPWRGRE
jgi:hypothetical protein